MDGYSDDNFKEENSRGQDPLRKRKFAIREGSKLVESNVITRAEKFRRPRKGIRTEMPISMPQSALWQATCIERCHHVKYV